MAETGALRLAETASAIVVSGELDVCSATILRARCAAGAPRVVDLAAVTFIDAAGLRCLLALRADGYLLRAPSTRVRQVARIAGVLPSLGFDQFFATPTDPT